MSKRAVAGDGIRRVGSGRYIGRWTACAAVLCVVLLLLIGFAWGLAGRLGVVQGRLTAALGLGEDWSDSAVAESQQRGEAIIAAIELYREREGKLPPTLESLSPLASSKIEPPVAGNRRWRYGALGSHSGEYFLLVESDYCDDPGYYGVEWHRYTSLDQKWYTLKDESMLFD